MQYCWCFSESFSALASSGSRPDDESTLHERGALIAIKKVCTIRLALISRQHQMKQTTSCFPSSPCSLRASPRRRHQCPSDPSLAYKLAPRPRHGGRTAQANRAPLLVLSVVTSVQIVLGRESMSSIEHPRIVPDGVSYSCNGRCGAGCSGAALGNTYTQDCYSHDICSYFNNASGGARYVPKVCCGT